MKNKVLGLIVLLGCIAINGTSLVASDVTQEATPLEGTTSDIVEDESEVESIAIDLEQKLQKYSVDQSVEKYADVTQQNYGEDAVFEQDGVIVDQNTLNKFNYAMHLNGNWYTAFFARNVSGDGIVLDDRVSYNSREIKVIDNVEYYVYYFTGNELDATITIHLVESKLVFEIAYLNKTNNDQQIKTFVDFDTCLAQNQALNFGGCIEDKVPIYSQGDAKGIYLNSERYDINFTIDYLGLNKPDYSKAYAWKTDTHLVANQINTTEGEVLLDNQDTAMIFGWDDTIEANQEIKYAFSFGIVAGEFVAIEDKIESDIVKSVKEEIVLSNQELIEKFNVSAIVDRMSVNTKILDVDQSAVNYSVPGEYQVIFSLIAPSGDELKRTVTLIVEDVLPTLTVDQSIVSINVNQQLEDILSQIKIEASEITIGDLTESIIVDNQEIDYTTAGEYILKIEALDEEGNNTFYNLAVIVEDDMKSEIKSKADSETKSKADSETKSEIDLEVKSEIDLEVKSEVESESLNQMSLMDTGQNAIAIVMAIVSLLGLVVTKQCSRF